MTDIRPFLRLQSLDYLTALRDKVTAELLSNVRFTNLSVNGKASGQDTHLPVAVIGEQLAEVLEEKGLVPANHETKPRMTLARFV